MKPNSSNGFTLNRHNESVPIINSWYEGRCMMDELCKNDPNHRNPVFECDRCGLLVHLCCMQESGRTSQSGICNSCPCPTMSNQEEVLSDDITVPADDSDSIVPPSIPQFQPTVGNTYPKPHRTIIDSDGKTTKEYREMIDGKILVVKFYDNGPTWSQSVR